MTTAVGPPASSRCDAHRGGGRFAAEQEFGGFVPAGGLGQQGACIGGWGVPFLYQAFGEDAAFGHEAVTETDVQPPQGVVGCFSEPCRGYPRAVRQVRGR